MKGVLEGEWKSKENPILKKLTGREAQQSFLRQFERYAIDDESSSWLDNVEEGSTTPHDADFDVESEVDLSAEGFLVVLAEASPGGIQKDKEKASSEAETDEIEETDGVDNEWPEGWE